jgi:heat shock protein HslJ
MTARRLRLLAVAATVLFVALVLGACSAPSPEVSPEGRPTTLAGTSWRVVSVGGRLPVALAVPTASFGDDRITGTGGCNTYGGRYQYDPATGRIELHDLGMTAMACAEAPRNDFETAFVQALGQINLVSVDGQGRMALSGPGGVIVLELDRQQPVEG